MGIVEEIAKHLAERLHLGQVDKAGRPYIEHLAAVATSHRFFDEESRAAAWLHDSMNNTEADISMLHEAHIPRLVVMMVDILTRRPREKYADYIDRVGRFPWTRAIKLADIDDYLANRTALPTSTVRRYEKARKALEEYDNS